MEFRRNTKRFFLAALHAQGFTKDTAYAALRPKVMDQVKPWIFSANVKGIGRRPKAISAQLVDLQNEISRVWNLIDREGNPVNADEYNLDDAPIDEVDEETAEPPKAKAKSRDDEKRWFVSEWKRIRAWIASAAETAGSSPIDSLDTMRPIQAARALIDEGVSAKTLIHSMTLHWPKASRENAGIDDVDFLSESKDLGEGFHRVAGYVLTLMNARQNVMLIGPAGTGKSRMVRKLAGLISTEAHPEGLPYAETPMTPGATRGDLLGRHTLDGFIPSQFVEIYSGGGVFNFEEIDASDPSMLIVVNNALASDRLYNSVNGEMYERHVDFVAVATANTFGLGADAKYTGREKLDLATIDRFRMGRVIVGLDETLAEYLMFGEGK